jgi:hypothetical protein
VLFYLQYIFSRRHGLFQVVSVPLRLLERLLKAIHAVKSGAVPIRVKEFYEAEFERADKADVQDALEKEFQAVEQVWEHLEEADICVLPSVLLMNKENDAQEW